MEQGKKSGGVCVEKVEFPALRVASLRRVGAYGPECGATFEALCAWAAKNNVFDGNSLVIGVFWDCPKVTPPEKCRMDACVTLSPGMNPPLEPGIVVQTLPGGLCMSYLCGIRDSNFGGAWAEMGEHMRQHNAEYDGGRPCYEIYYGPCAETHPLKKWIVELISPIV